ncbi:MAG: Fe-S cluster assembly protein SufD [Actinomycetota bacterium]
MTSPAIELAPPTDLAPRVRSLSPADFAVPTGREEEWRFIPSGAFAQFMQPSADAGHVTVAEGPASLIPISELVSTWIPIDRPSSIARAEVTHAVILDIPAEHEAAEPIHLRLSATSTVAYEHVEIRFGRFSTATVVIDQPANSAVCGSIVVSVGDGASATVVNVNDGDRDHEALLTWHADLGRDAHFTGTQVSLGGSRLRVLPSVAYLGTGGNAQLLGVFLADHGQFMEHRLFVDHDRPHCTSNVVYKGAIADDKSHTVWVGDVLVRREATGIDTYEINRNLLLSDGARADSVPNLELETGDVASAGHASATGRFDDDQLFYLQARGIDEETARQLVVRGFFADIVSRIPDPEWQADIMGRIGARLGVPAEIGGDDD